MLRNYRALSDLLSKNQAFVAFQQQEQNAMDLISSIATHISNRHQP